METKLSVTKSKGTTGTFQFAALLVRSDITN